MPSAPIYVTAAQDALVARFRALRQRLWVNYELGSRFSVLSGKLFRAHGLSGIAESCATLALWLQDIPGAWLEREEALSVARVLAASLQ